MTDSERLAEAIKWWGAETTYAPPPGCGEDAPAEAWVPDGRESRIAEAVLLLLEAVRDNEWACTACRTFVDNGAGDMCPEHEAVYGLVEATLLGGTQ